MCVMCVCVCGGGGGGGGGGGMVNGDNQNYQHFPNR